MNNIKIYNNVFIPMPVTLVLPRVFHLAADSIGIR
jgi:hypothetical protein